MSEHEYSSLTVEEYAQRSLRNIELYEGRAYNVLPTNQLDLDVFGNNDPYAPQKNFYKLITDTFVNLSCFEPPSISLDINQEWFDEYSENNDFNDFIKDSFKVASIAGDTVAVIYQENDYFKIQIIDNSIWEPVFEGRSNAEATLNILNYSYNIDKKRYIVQKRFNYNPNTNETQTEIVVKQGDDFLSFDFIPQEIKESFGITDESSLYGLVEAKVFFRFQNEKSLRDYFGLSDYTENVIATTNLINNLITLEYYVQIKTGKAMLAVPDSLLSSAEDMANRFNQSGEATRDVFNTFTGFIGNTFDNLAKIISKKEKLKKLDFIPMKAGDTPPQFIQPNSTVAEIEITIDKLKKELFEDLALPNVLISDDIRTGNLSGVALQKMMTRTLHKKGAREIRMKSFLRDIIFNLIVLNGEKEEKPTIKFGDGIINDRNETIAEMQALLNLSMITRIDAIKELHGLTEKQAQNYIDDIDLQNGNINDGMFLKQEEEKVEEQTDV